MAIYNHWQPIDTGGGCTALRAWIDDRRSGRMLITDADDPSIPEPDAPCYLGIYLYGANDEEIQISGERFANATEAREYAESWARDAFNGGMS